MTSKLVAALYAVGDSVRDVDTSSIDPPSLILAQLISSAIGAGKEKYRREHFMALAGACFDFQAGTRTDIEAVRDLIVNRVLETQH